MGTLRAVRSIVRAFLGLTWAIPIVLLAIGGALLPMARRLTGGAWLAATSDVPDEPVAPSATDAPLAASQGPPP